MAAAGGAIGDSIGSSIVKLLVIGLMMAGFIDNRFFNGFEF